MTAGDGITVTSEGPVATVTIGDGSRHNALGDAGWASLGDTFRELADDPELGAVVLRGGGRSFSAGFDIRDWAHASPADVEASFTLMEAACTAVEELPVPVIARVGGIAAGGGCQLVLACDLRVFGRHALIGMPVARWAILVSPAFAARLSMLAGPGVARDLLYTGRLVGTAEASRLGLVSRAVPDARLDVAVGALAAAITVHPPAAIRAAKRAVSAGLGPVTDAVRSAPAGPSVEFPQFHQGISAFLRSRGTAR